MGLALHPHSFQERLPYGYSAHTKPIISISTHDENTFFTSSEDDSMRMWDVRLHSSVKMFRSENVVNLSNCESDGKFMLFVGGGKHVYSYDIRNENVLVGNVFRQSEEEHFDDVSSIKLDVGEGIVGVSDDEGDVRLYNFDL